MSGYDVKVIARPLLYLLLAAAATRAAEPVVQDRVYFSQVFGETRNYQIILPADYESSGKRYPVIYWFHGDGERFNSAFPVAPQDVIVVRPDGFNPRFSGDDLGRPYNIGPVETARQFPLYFPELVEFIDSSFRTVPDREHRATSGNGIGGFMAYWIAGKYPHLVASASSVRSPTEFEVGPRDFPVTLRHDDMYGNYEGVSTRLLTGAPDPAQFYARQLNSIWQFTRPWHEIEESDSLLPDLAKTLEFHSNAFAHPLPRPSVWSHTDVYPNFEVWGWDVGSDRKQPGFTVLDNVSVTGFRSAVREWLPGGAAIPAVKLSIATDRRYAPRKPQSVTIVHLADGKVRRQTLTADGEGRLHLELDGAEYEVGISSAPLLAISGYELEDAAWATAGAPVHIRVRIWNKGAALASASALRWVSPNPGVELDPISTPLPALPAGQSAGVRLSFTARDSKRAIVRLFAVQGDSKLPLAIPLFPPAQSFPDFRIADGQSFRIFQHATAKVQLPLGDGNGDGIANPGERIAILIPEDDAYRVAELFSNDACLDNTLRVTDDWSDYEHLGASAKYSLPIVKPACETGHVIHLLARVLLPHKPKHVVRYAAVDLTVR